jgi:hypothetical protein
MDTGESALLLGFSGDRVKLWRRERDSNPRWSFDLIAV